MRFNVRCILLKGTEGVKCRCGRPAKVVATVYGGPHDGEGEPECEVCGAMWLKCIQGGKGTTTKFRKTKDGRMRPEA